MNGVRPVVICLALLLSRTCFAAEAPASPAESSARNCVAIEDANSRLSCYDEAFGRRTPEARAVPGGGFGFTDAQQRARDGTAAKPRAEPERLEAVVTVLELRNSGRLGITLDNGQVWAQAEAAGDARLSPGDKVTIRKASLGSYLMQRGRGLAVRVVRVR